MHGTRPEIIRAAAAGYDRGVNQPVTRSDRRLRRALRGYARKSGSPRLAIWRGVIGVYNSDDLTFASSIAYYALLSLFPFFLLAFSILGGVTADADRDTMLGSSSATFPRQFEFVDDPDGRAAGLARAARRRRQPPDDLGGDGRLRRDYVCRQSRLGRREAAELLQAQADLVRDAGRRQPAAARRPRCGERDQRRRGALVRRPSSRARRSWSCFTASRSGGRRPSSSSSSSAWSSTSCPTPRSGSATCGSARSSPGLLWRGALSGFSWYVSDLTRFSVHGIDRRGRGVSGLGLHLGRHPAVRRRGHGRQRAPAPPSAGRNPGRARASMTRSRQRWPTLLWLAWRAPRRRRRRSR